jgi:hypothetical protein
MFSVAAYVFVGLGLLNGTVGKSVLAERAGQSAVQCVQRVDYPAGTNNLTYPFSRFTNTCNAAVYMDITVPGGYKLVGLAGPGIAMTINWYDGNVKGTEIYACLYPAEPWVSGARFFNPPTYGQSYECIIP